MRIGCHISIRGGYFAAASAAKAIGADAFQFFSKNPRSLTVKEIDADDAARCRQWIKQHGITSVIHSPYPVNLATPDEGMQTAVVRTIRNDLEIADASGAMGVVVHFGHYKGESPLHGYKNILQCIHRIFEGYSGEALMLLENQAGGNPPMGTTAEELLQIRSLSAHAPRIGFCLDTCHAFASGLFTERSFTDFIDEAHRSGFFSLIKAIHLNDSVYPAHSGKDRHANIGQGHLGLELLKLVVRTFRHTQLPVILETPKQGESGHQQEMMLIRQWLSES